jgi:predicted AAA+ superfamily ATPase
MSLIGSHARLRDYDGEIKWLIDSKIVIQINALKQPLLPLRSNEIENSFKLYLLDAGMLGAKMNINPNLILDDSSNYVYKGALTENYVFHQIKSNTTSTPYYFLNNTSTQEIDCILELDNNIIPIEIKSTTNVKSSSLK